MTNKLKLLCLHNGNGDIKVHRWNLSLLIFTMQQSSKVTELIDGTVSEKDIVFLLLIHVIDTFRATIRWGCRAHCRYISVGLRRIPF